MRTFGMSDGRTFTASRLTVVNVTGISEERGFRLYWDDGAEGTTRLPALGYATSYPFRTEREAIAFGLRNWNERAIRAPG